MADILLQRPEAEQTQTITPQAEDRLVFDFDSTEATLSRDGDNLVMSFDDGANISLNDFYVAYNSENMPTFLIGDAEIDGESFFSAFGEELMPAAGTTASVTLGSGSTVDTIAGTLLGGIDRLGGLDQGYPQATQDNDTIRTSTFNVASTFANTDDTQDSFIAENVAPTLDITDGSVVESGVKAKPNNNEGPNTAFGGTEETIGTIIIGDANTNDTHSLSVGGESIIAGESYFVVFENNEYVLKSAADGYDANSNAHVGSMEFTGSGKSYTYVFTLNNDNKEVNEIPEGDTLTPPLSLSVTVTDSSQASNATASGSLDITVTGSNEKPTFSLSNTKLKYTDEGDTDDLSGTVEDIIDLDSNATHTFFVAEGKAGKNDDEDGPALTVTTTTISNDWGTFSIDATGKYTFTPNKDKISCLGEGEKEKLSYTIYVQDDQGAWTSKVVSVVISGINDIPKLVVEKPSSITVDESYMSGGTLEGQGDGHRASSSMAFTSAESMVGGSITIEGESFTIIEGTGNDAGKLFLQPESGKDLSVEGDYGKLTIEGELKYDKVTGEYTVDYTYEQTESFAHPEDADGDKLLDNDHNEQKDKADSFDIIIRDGKEDSSNPEGLETSITVNIKDDGPVIVGDEPEGVEGHGQTEATVTNNMANAELTIDFGADGAGKIVVPKEFGAATTDMVATWNPESEKWEGWLVEHEKGSSILKIGDVTFEMDANGTWNITYGIDDARNLELHFYDSDGDFVSHTITAKAPSIDITQATGTTYDAAVQGTNNPDTAQDEGREGEASGLQPTEAEDHFMGSFIVSAGAEADITQITIGGTNILDGEGNVIKDLVIEGAFGEITDITYDKDTGKVDFTYTQTNNSLEHGNESHESFDKTDIDTDDFEITITDSKGNTTTQENGITANIVDDVIVLDSDKDAYNIEAAEGEALNSSVEFNKDDLNSKDGTFTVTNADGSTTVYTIYAGKASFEDGAFSKVEIVENATVVWGHKDATGPYAEGSGLTVSGVPGGRDENELAYSEKGDFAEAIIIDLPSTAYGVNVNFELWFSGDAEESGDSEDAIVIFYRELTEADVASGNYDYTTINGKNYTEVYTTSKPSAENSGVGSAGMNSITDGVDLIVVAPSTPGSDFVIAGLDFILPSDTVVAQTQGEITWKGADGLGSMNIDGIEGRSEWQKYEGSKDTDAITFTEQSNLTLNEGTAEEQMLTLLRNDDGNVIRAVNADGQIIFELLLNNQKGTWKLFQYEELNSSLDITFSATDGDGDTADITVTVHPSAASAATISDVDTQENSIMAAIDNTHLSASDTGTIHIETHDAPQDVAISMEGHNLTFDSDGNFTTGPLSIESDHGVISGFYLEKTADGSGVVLNYTYTTNTQKDAAESDNLTVSVETSEGFTALSVDVDLSKNSPQVDDVRVNMQTDASTHEGDESWMSLIHEDDGIILSGSYDDLVFTPILDSAQGTDNNDLIIMPKLEDVLAMDVNGGEGIDILLTGVDSLDDAAKVLDTVSSVEILMFDTSGSTNESILTEAKALHDSLASKNESDNISQILEQNWGAGKKYNENYMQFTKEDSSDSITILVNSNLLG